MSGAPAGCVLLCSCFWCIKSEKACLFPRVHKNVYPLQKRTDQLVHIAPLPFQYLFLWMSLCYSECNFVHWIWVYLVIRVIETWQWLEVGIGCCCWKELKWLGWDESCTELCTIYFWSGVYFGVCLESLTINRKPPVAHPHPGMTDRLLLPPSSSHMHVTDLLWLNLSQV